MDPAAIRAFVRRRFSKEEAVGLYFTVSLLVCVALSACFAVVAREVSLTTITPKSFDGVVGGFLYGLRSAPRTRAMELVTFFGDPRFVVFATAAVGLGFLLAHRRVSALLFVGTVAGGFALMSAFKIALSRARPQLWPSLVKETTYSFPSGHATMSTVFFGGLVAVVFHLSRRRLHRALAILLAFVFVAGVAASRIYLGAHWATDTIAGILLGLFWVVLYATGTEFVTRAARRAGGYHRPHRPRAPMKGER